MDFLYQVLEKSLTQGIATAISTAVGLFIGYLTARKKRAAGMAKPFLYGLVAASAVLVIFWAYAAIAKLEPVTTTDNIEERVVKWCNSFKLQISRLDKNPDAKWQLACSVPHSRAVLAFVNKDQDRYLMIQSALRIDQRHVDVLKRLSAADKEKFSNTLSIELLRTGTLYDMLPATELPVITLSRRIPITPDLNESTFIKNFDEVAQATTLILLVVRRELEPLAPPDQ